MIEPESSQILFDQFFKTPFCIIDLARIEDEVLKKQIQDHIKGISLLLTLKHVFDKNIQFLFEHVLVNAYKQLDKSGNRDDVADMLYYLLNEAEYINEERFWTILQQEFSKEVESKLMTIAQRLELRGMEKGIEKGREEGKEEWKRITVERLLSINADKSFITEITGLTLEEIEELN